MQDETMIKIGRALLSVANKEGLEELAACLQRREVEIVSTGGTAEYLRKAGCTVVDVSELTGLGEALGGRVKTLHPALLGSILMDRDKPEQIAELASVNGRPIDLVVVDFYPFEKMAAGQTPVDELVEYIDIGGPTMVRSAAKNHRHVAVVVDRADHAQVIASLDANKGAIPRQQARELAQKAFRKTSDYDQAIAAGFGAEEQESGFQLPDASRRLQSGRSLRYGENPHQQAAAYLGKAEIEQLGGGELSYNNFQDGVLAWRAASEHDMPACAIVKHATPCGVGAGSTLKEAFDKALRADPVSAYGGVVACNEVLDEETLKAVRETFFEVLICKGYDEKTTGSVAKLKRLKSIVGPIGSDGFEDGRIFGDLVLLQQRDAGVMPASELKCVTRCKPGQDCLDNLMFAWRVVKYAKSNAVVLAGDGGTLGIGAGQTSRVRAAEQAVAQARSLGHSIENAVAASDAFFPFADGLEVLAQAGVKAVVQPGGSKRDDEVIAAADAAGMAMVFSGRRAFSH